MELRRAAPELHFAKVVVLVACLPGHLHAAADLLDQLGRQPHHGIVAVPVEIGVSAFGCQDDCRLRAARCSRCLIFSPDDVGCLSLHRDSNSISSGFMRMEPERPQWRQFLSTISPCPGSCLRRPQA